MTQQAPFPAIDPNELGDLVAVNIDRLLIPYMLGQLQLLTDASLYYGDAEDIVGTIYAFQLLLNTLGET